jgi:hypothetical protein
MMKSKNKLIAGFLGMAVSATASAAPVVLEWIQTASGTATYLNSRFDPVTVSSAGIATGGRIVLADQSFLSSNISLGVTTQYGVPATLIPPIIEISFNSDRATTGRDPRTFTYGIPSLGTAPSSNPVNCPYLVDLAPSSSGGLRQDAYCEANINLVRDVTHGNRFYGVVSTGFSTPTGGTLGSLFILDSGNPLRSGSVLYIIPGGGSDYRVTVPISGYWQQVLPPTNVPLPSALFLLLTGLGLLAVKLRK